MMKRTSLIGLGLSVTVLLLAGCGGSGQYAAKEDTPRGGPVGTYDPNAEGLFGEGGLTLSKIAGGNLFGNERTEGSTTPVNKFLWQAALDTLSFMPLSSTDPFTGVIATDWSATPDAPGERFKVTVYMSSPALSAISLKVAVYRQVQNEAGTWVQTSVDPATPRKIEDAILTRARQIRVAELEAGSAG